MDEKTYLPDVISGASIRDDKGQVFSKKYLTLDEAKKKYATKAEADFSNPHIYELGDARAKDGDYVFADEGIVVEDIDNISDYQQNVMWRSSLVDDNKAGTLFGSTLTEKDDGGEMLGSSMIEKEAQDNEGILGGSSFSK